MILEKHLFYGLTGVVENERIEDNSFIFPGFYGNSLKVKLLPWIHKGLVANLLRKFAARPCRKGLQRKAHRPATGRAEDLERKARLVAILHSKIAARPCVLGFCAPRTQKRAHN
jgi:hypothetical protein